MPYLKLCISIPAPSDITGKLVAILMRHTSEILGKKPEVTSVHVEFVAPEQWFVGGVPMSEQNRTTFYLDVKITEGTNTKAQKADYVRQVFSDFESVLGSVEPASYIVIHDVRADAWGFQGQTQEYRFIQSRSV